MLSAGETVSLDDTLRSDSAENLLTAALPLDAQSRLTAVERDTLSDVATRLPKDERRKGGQKREGGPA